MGKYGKVELEVESGNMEIWKVDYVGVHNGIPLMKLPEKLLQCGGRIAQYVNSITVAYS